MIDAAVRDFRFSLRRLLIAVTAIAILLAGYAWFDERYLEPRRRSQSIREQLRGLALRRPAELTPRQWESAVAWTGNLHANSLLSFEADGRTIRGFDGRLREKLKGHVNLATIHWIWNEYASLCPHGESYQRFHALMMEEIEAGGGNWGMTIP